MLLCYVRHLARADPSQDHSRILRAAINRPPADWRCRAGRPRRTWLRTIELDLRPHNIGLNTAWMRAQDRSKWRQLVETAILMGALLDDDDDRHGGQDSRTLALLYRTCSLFTYKTTASKILVR